MEGRQEDVDPGLGGKNCENSKMKTRTANPILPFKIATQPFREGRPFPVCLLATHKTSYTGVLIIDNTLGKTVSSP